jgi:xanthine/uracil permease
LLKRSKNNFFEDEAIFIGIFFGIVSYLIAGIFNDSIVAIAPIFWLFLGVSMSLQHRPFQSYSPRTLD